MESEVAIPFQQLLRAIPQPNNSTSCRRNDRYPWAFFNARHFKVLLIATFMSAVVNNIIDSEDRSTKRRNAINNKLDSQVHESPMNTNARNAIVNRTTKSVLALCI